MSWISRDLWTLEVFERLKIITFKNDKRIYLTSVLFFHFSLILILTNIRKKLNYYHYKKKTQMVEGPINPNDHI